MNAILVTLSHLEGPQLVAIIIQAFTFLGMIVTAIGTYLVGRQNARGMAKMQEIKIEINGRVAQLLQAHGEAAETRGFAAGKLAERANPQVPVAKLLDLAIGVAGPRGSAGVEGATGPTGPTGAMG